MKSAFAIALLTVAFAVSAATGSGPVLEGDCASYIIIEADTGIILDEFNAYDPRPAASMVKMMLFLLVSEGLQEGRWTLEQTITVSKLAESVGGSQVHLKEGEQFPLSQMMAAIAVSSANDAAVAVAEGLWGTREAYLGQVNIRAKELGMVDSVFYSVNGLPPGKDEKLDQTTARDMAILAQWCVRHPRIMEWASMRTLQFRPDEPLRENTNQLLSELENCDGLKTGFTRAAGWCLAATTKKDGLRLITVVMGGVTSKLRFRRAQQLLDEGYAKVQRVLVVKRGQPIEQRTAVANCEIEGVRLVAAQDAWAVVRTEELDLLSSVPTAPITLAAPLQAGAAIGELRVQLPDRVLVTVPLLVPQDLPEAGWHWKLKNTVLQSMKSITGG